VPDGDGPFTVVVLVHGGFWRERYRRDLMSHLATDLVERGYATWNIEYGRVRGSGGWPQTFEDAAAAVDHLAQLDDARLDLARVITVGHSAGGHLAVWLAARPGLPDDAPGAAPRVQPCAAVSLGGVLDLRRAAEGYVGQNAVVDLMGGTPDDHDERYRIASPLDRIPIGVPIVLIHGVEDDVVPVEQSDDFGAAAANAGDEVELVALDGQGHYELFDLASPTWNAVTERLGELCP